MKNLLITGVAVLFCSGFVLADDYSSIKDNRADNDPTNDAIVDVVYKPSTAKHEDACAVHNHEIHGAHITWGVGSTYANNLLGLHESRDNKLGE